VGGRELYTLWLANRRHRRNLEQIEIDDIDEIATTATDDDRADTLNPIYDNHATRRVAARFLVATAERPRLERLAKRWHVDAPKMIVRGEANEAAITHIRRAIREARWIFMERCAKILIPILSLLVAAAALLFNFSRHP
jgi:hypothetical protein